MTEIQYNRKKAVAYARKWAFARNPNYYDFGDIGGDCTNFASQCIYAGCGVMNYTPTYGWYYISVDNRSPAWTAARYLYDFLTSNEYVGPYGVEEMFDKAELADIIQLSFDGKTWTHSLPIVGFANGQPLVAAHSFNALDRPLNTYAYVLKRLIHIQGARK